MRYELYNTQRRRFSFNNFKVCQPKDKDGYKSDILTESDVIASSRIDSDGAWKYALETMFFEFLQLFFPDLYALLDTSFKPESKETELKELLLGLKSKQRIVDKLVRVKYKNGKSAFLMIHIEIESKANTYNQQQLFAARMYEYYTMLSSKFKNQDIVNIGVLINSHGLAMSKSESLTGNHLCANSLRSVLLNTDQTNIEYMQNNMDNHKQSKSHQDFLVHKQSHPSGQELSFKFPVIHLAQWLGREDELKILAYKNPFAIMVLYQLIVLKYKNKNKRLNAKVQIMRLGNQYGYSREMMAILLYLIDWVITLPIDLQREYYKEVRKMEDEVKDRFVSIYEIIGKEEGLAEGLEQGQTQGQVSMLLKLLAHKFNNVPDVVVERIKSASLDQIQTWSLNLINAQTIDEVFGD